MDKSKAKTKQHIKNTIILPLIKTVNSSPKKDNHSKLKLIGSNKLFLFSNSKEKNDSKLAESIAKFNTLKGTSNQNSLNIVLLNKNSFKERSKVFPSSTHPLGIVTNNYYNHNVNEDDKYLNLKNYNNSNANKSSENNNIDYDEVDKNFTSNNFIDPKTKKGLKNELNPIEKSVVKFNNCNVINKESSANTSSNLITHKKNLDEGKTVNENSINKECFAGKNTIQDPNINNLLHPKKPPVIPTASKSKSVDRFADTAKSKNSNNNNNGVLNSKILIKNKLSSLKNSNLNKKESGTKPDALSPNSESDKKENEEKKPEKKEMKRIFYYLVLKGNNSNLIKKSMAFRTNWREIADTKSQLFHFKWRHISSGRDFCNMAKSLAETQVLNHFEYHPVISNKLNLFLNVMRFCERQNLEVFRIMPLTVIFHYDNPSFQTQFDKFEKVFYCIHNYIANSSNQVEFELKKKSLNKYLELFKIGIYNASLGSNSTAFIEESHFSGKNLWLVKATDLNRGRCIKISKKVDEIKNLIKNFSEGISRDPKANSDDEANFKTDAKGKGNKGSNKNAKNASSNKEAKKEKKTLKVNREKESNKNPNTNADAIRNGSNSPNESNANGVIGNTNKANVGNEKISDLKDIGFGDLMMDHNFNALKQGEQEEEEEEAEETSEEEKPKKKKLKKYKANCVIVQKYIEKPLLYWGRKFDIRMWVLIDHKCNIYAFKEGHLKTSSKDYNLEKQDVFIHLTNYSVQKYCENFGANEQGNEVSFSDFQNMLDKTYGTNKISVRRDIYEKIKFIIKIVGFAAKERLNMNERKFCFEIFGFDFIVDKNFEVFLLEANTNPGLEESSELIKALVPRMIDDTLRLTVDEVFETKYSQDLAVENQEGKIIYKSPYPVSGYDDTENMWDLIANFKGDF